VNNFYGTLLNIDRNAMCQICWNSVSCYWSYSKKNLRLIFCGHGVYLVGVGLTELEIWVLGQILIYPTVKSSDIRPLSFWSP